MNRRDRTRSVCGSTRVLTVLLVAFAASSLHAEGSLERIAVEASGQHVSRHEVDASAYAMPIHCYGLTLGPEWQGFPSVLAPDYLGSQDGRLDVQLDLHVDWEMHYVVGECLGDVCGDPRSLPTKVSPRPLSTEPWFDPERVEAIQLLMDFVSDQTYNACPDNWPFEQPDGSNSHVLTSTGGFRIIDEFGGIGTETTWVFRRVDFDLGARPREVWLALLQWGLPGTHTDASTGLPVDVAPGQSVARPVGIEVVTRTNCGNFICRRDMNVTSLAVGWPSSDMPGTSPRYTDSADLAAFAGAYRTGGDVVYGFASEGGPSARTYQADFAPFGDSAGRLDEADISAFVADLGLSVCKRRSAFSAPRQRQAVLDWFGIAATGATIVVGPNGERVPEYRFVDPEQTAAALRHPEGYTGLPAALPRAWGIVKQLYR